ncbi:MAG: hypothetical protein GX219_06680 [Tissierellia bacterium]|nr:hypothetical protein [Tissierellia bacterium]
MKSNFDDNFEDRIRKGIDISVNNIFPSEFVKDKIDLEIKKHRNSLRGGYKMKRTSKILAICAGIILLFGVGVYAVSSLSSTIGTVDNSKLKTSYEDVVDLKKEADLNDAVIPQSLAGDYDFANINMGAVHDVDESGEEVNARNDLIVEYKTRSGKVVYLTIEKYFEGSLNLSNDEYTEVVKVDGRTFYYTKLENLLLGSEDQLTEEEDERRETDPFFNVAFTGKDGERDSEVSQHLTLVDGSIIYSFIADESLSQEEFFNIGKGLFE